MTRCALCSAPCVRELEPAVGSLPAITEPDVWRVVARSRLIREVCLRCWMLWPDPWKHFPAEGFGHSEERIDDLVGVLRETA